MQEDASFPCVLIIGKGSHPLQKQRWVRQPKAVDALLDVAHHKQAAVFAVDALQNRVLHRRHILAFIHKNVIVFFLQAFAAFLIFQNGQRQLLHVAEVHHILSQLVFVKIPFCRFHQHSHTSKLPLNHVQLCFCFLPVRVQRLGLLLHDCFDFISYIRKTLFPYSLVLCQTAAHRRLFKGGGCQRLRQLLRRGEVRLHQQLIQRIVLLKGFFQLRYCVRFQKHILLCIKQGLNTLKLPLRMRCQHGIPRMLLIWLLIDPFYLPIQPVKGFGQRHQKGIEPLGHFAYFILFKGVGKQMKLRMLAFQQLVHRVAEG